MLSREVPGSSPGIFKILFMPRFDQLTKLFKLREGLIPELIYKIWDEISELKPRFNEDKKEILKERWIRRLSKQVNSIFDKDHRPHKYCVNYEHPVTDLSSSTFEIFKGKIFSIGNSH